MSNDVTGPSVSREEFDARMEEVYVALNHRVGPIEKAVIEIPVALKRQADELATMRMDIVNLKGAVEAQKRAIERLLVALERPKRRIR